LRKRDAHAPSSCSNTPLPFEQLPPFPSPPPLFLLLLSTNGQRQQAVALIRQLGGGTMAGPHPRARPTRGLDSRRATETCRDSFGKEEKNELKCSHGAILCPPRVFCLPEHSSATPSAQGWWTGRIPVSGPLPPACVNLPGCAGRSDSATNHTPRQKFSSCDRLLPDERVAYGQIFKSVGKTIGSLDFEGREISSKVATHVVEADVWGQCECGCRTNIAPCQGCSWTRQGVDTED
jgi:hypothetical protein